MLRCCLSSHIKAEYLRFLIYLHKKQIDMKKYRVWAIVLIMISCTSHSKDSHQIKFAIDEKSNLRFSMSNSLCFLINYLHKNKGSTNYHCRAIETSGTLENIKLVANKEVDIAIVQTDWLGMMLQFTHDNKNKSHHLVPQKWHSINGLKNIRSLFSLYPIPLSIMVLEESDIQGFKDLKGKKVYAGHPNSGTRATVGLVLKQLGWKEDDIDYVNTIRIDRNHSDLCKKKVNAMIVLTEQPNLVLNYSAKHCKTRLFGISIRSLIEDYAWYRHALLIGEIYGGNEGWQHTIGTGLVAITNKDIDDGKINEVVRIVFSALGNIKEWHPALTHLDKGQMANFMIFAPLHQVAENFYIKKGLINN